MSAEGAVKVDHLWKRFRVDRGRRLLRDHLSRSYSRARGSKNEHTWRWVLRDIDFEVAPGESIGIIGANGAGKSTLLKCVSGLMFPYAGAVTTQGQVGALIEVAAGIHSELTGRENITTYGNLLGLGRKQVADRFDEIVEFAEIEDAIDRQVKFYSSGMKVRLGFAVAAFLEPAILIVDEVLAVGDSSFQQKCLERMRHVLASGTTLLLVSHDLAAVGASVSRGIWLADGVVQSDGPIEGVLSDYRSAIEARAEEDARMQGGIRVTSMTVTGEDGRLPEVAGDCTVRLTVTSDKEQNARLFLGVSEGAATPIFVVMNGTTIPEGETTFEVVLEHLPLPPKRFFLWFGAWHMKTKDEITPWQPIGPLILHGRRRLDPVPKAIVRLSPVYVSAHWSRVGG
jgi:ABC-type polysaccharide/polyol phosphate transport system ATPase subunit